MILDHSICGISLAIVCIILAFYCTYKTGIRALKANHIIHREAWSTQGVQQWET